MVMVTVLAITVAAPGLWAQTTATIQGTVTGPTNAPLQGVEVSASGDQGSWTAQTDNRGFYSIPDLPPGTYRLTASLDPFASREVEDLELLPGQTLTQNLTLESLTFGGEVRAV